MEFHRKHRVLYPDVVFETRVLPPVDGIPRLITLASSYWKKLDFFKQHNIDSLENITEFCLEYAKSRVEKKPELDFAFTFHDAVMYYIYGGYFRYFKGVHNIANDFWDPRY